MNKKSYYRIISEHVKQSSKNHNNIIPNNIKYFAKHCKDYSAINKVY